jgi:hypothetical protein
MDPPAPARKMRLPDRFCSNGSGLLSAQTIVLTQSAIFNSSLNPLQLLPMPGNSTISNSSADTQHVSYPMTVISPRTRQSREVQRYSEQICTADRWGQRRISHQTALPHEYLEFQIASPPPRTWCPEVQGVTERTSFD